MRGTSFLATLVFAASLGCRDGPTAPPSGLPVTLSFTTNRPPLPSPTVQAAGDSVVATYVWGASGCNDTRADAGLVGDGVLVISVTATPSDRFCVASVSLSSFIDHFVLHGAPSRHHLVIVANRWAPANGNNSSRTEVMRQVVTLP